MSNKAGKRWKPVVHWPLGNRLRNLFGRFSWNQPDLSFDRLKKTAEETTGLSDWGDGECLENLRVLLDSFNKESDCPIQARREFAKRLVFTGVQRLHLISVLKNHPEINDVPVERPIFIAGLPRTGTTLLHRMLGSDPDSRPLLLWEARAPLPPPDPNNHTQDPRIGVIEAGIQQMYQQAPGLKAIHFFGASSPDECCPLFIRNFSSLAYPLMYHLPTFSHYAKNLDMRASYRFHKQQLQILSWRFPKRRWVLKEPSHLIYLDALLDVFPDAQVLLTHRNPLDVVPSYCSLTCYHRALSGQGAHADPIEMGEHQLDLLSFGWRRAVSLRKDLNAKNLYDVPYHQMMKDPVAQIKAIYNYFGESFSEEKEAAMTQWLKDNRQHKHGSHDYGLEQFGLDETAVRRVFAPYYKEYPHFLVG